MDLINKKHLNNTIFIIDDDADIVSTLVSFFELKGFKAQGFSSAMAYLKTLDNTPGLLISDVSMPIMSGIELLEVLNNKQHTRPSLFVTGVATIELAVKAMELGASGFIEKPVLTKILLNKVIEILAKFEQDSEVNLQYQSLTKRERQIFELVIKGLFNHDIAEQLFITVSTVEKHRSSMMKKMKVKTLTALATQASKLNLSNNL